jgi:hypothetical protein
MDQMEQMSVVPFLQLKGLSKKTIYHEFVVVLQENTVSYSSVTSVTRFCKEAILGPNSEEVSLSPKDDGLDEMNKVILLALSDKPLSFVRQIVRKISVSKSTIYCQIVNSLRFTVRNLH